MLPDPNSRVWENVEWGRVEVPLTPSFWVMQCRYWSELNHHSENFRLGNSLREEAAACVLGGHGIPAEVGLAAFVRLRKEGVFCSEAVDETKIFRCLQEPLEVGQRTVKYRFARQKSRYVARMLEVIDDIPGKLSDREMRDWMMQLPGIGPKTASWIVRNWRSSNEVAIIDIHLVRAGILTGFFSADGRLPKDYSQMEKRFLSFANAIGVPASTLDAVIWQQMRRGGTLIHRMIQKQSASPKLDAVA